MGHKLIYSIITRNKSSEGRTKRFVSLRKKEKDLLVKELKLWVDETTDRYFKDVFISRTYNCYDYLLISDKLESEDGIKIIELINEEKIFLKIKRVDYLGKQISPYYPFVGILKYNEKVEEKKINSLNEYLLLKQRFFNKIEEKIMGRGD